MGLNAGKQPEPGLYLADQLVFYGSNTLRDRNGGLAPVEGFRLRAWVNGFGVAATLALGGTYLNFAVSAPLVDVSLNSTVPQASIDKFGLSDARVQPLGLGWRTARLDLGGSYALYIPTRRYEPGGTGSVSRGAFSHEFALRGTVYADRDRQWYLTAMASYELNQRKIGIDITRGDTVQIQGGIGGRVLKVIDVGLAGYALWQVKDDSGSDLPPVLAGSRDRVFGLGPEVGVLIPPIRTKLSLRYEADFGVNARPQAQIASLTANFLLWDLAKKASGAPAK